MEIDELLSDKRRQKWGVNPQFIVLKETISVTSGMKVVKAHQQNVLS